MEPVIRTVPVGQLGTCCYVVSLPGRDDCFVIDPGDEPERILAAADGKRVAAVLLTHGHFDHIAAADAVLRDGGELVIHAADAPMLRDPGLNVSWTFMRQAVTVQHLPDRLVAQGEVLEAAGMQLTVLHTPGHTPGGVCYQLGDVYFTGDTLFHGGYGRTDLPGGSEAGMVRSVRRMMRLCRDTQFYPGHG